MAEEVIKIFYSYSRKDVKLQNKLEDHLSALKKANKISTWHDLELSPGTEWERDIQNKLDTADIILLLVSSNFIASDYCYSIELQRAIARHNAGEARVIPVILSPCDWNHAGVPFSKLNVLPTDAKAITSWADSEEAFTIVAQRIRETVDQLIDQKQKLRQKNTEAERRRQEEHERKQTQEAAHYYENSTKVPQQSYSYKQSTSVSKENNFQHEGAKPLGIEALQVGNLENQDTGISPSFKPRSKKFRFVGIGGTLIVVVTAIPIPFINQFRTSQGVQFSSSRVSPSSSAASSTNRASPSSSIRASSTPEDLAVQQTVDAVRDMQLDASVKMSLIRLEILLKGEDWEEASQETKAVIFQVANRSGNNPSNLCDTLDKLNTVWLKYTDQGLLTALDRWFSADADNNTTLTSDQTTEKNKNFEELKFTMLQLQCHQNGLSNVLSTMHDQSMNSIQHIKP